MHYQFGEDQQGHGHKKTDVDFKIHQERYCHGMTEQMSVERRERQQRQPGHKRDDENPLADQLQCIVGHVHPAQQLEERAAKNQ